MGPALLGVAPRVGPFDFSGQDTGRAWRDGNAGLLVHDREEIYRALRNFLDHPGTAAEIGARARQVILDHRGATEQNFALIERYLSSR
jgi:3-deoxy-D-manno-octulosonic-acid transferase